MPYTPLYCTPYGWYDGACIVRGARCDGLALGPGAPRRVASRMWTELDGVAVGPFRIWLDCAVRPADPRRVAGMGNTAFP